MGGYGEGSPQGWDLPEGDVMGGGSAYHGQRPLRVKHHCMGGPRNSPLPRVKSHGVRDPRSSSDGGIGFPQSPHLQLWGEGCLGGGGSEGPPSFPPRSRRTLTATAQNWTTRAAQRDPPGPQPPPACDLHPPPLRTHTQTPPSPPPHHHLYSPKYLYKYLSISTELCAVSVPGGGGVRMGRGVRPLFV